MRYASWSDSLYIDPTSVSILIRHIVFQYLLLPSLVDFMELLADYEEYQASQY